MLNELELKYNNVKIHIPLSYANTFITGETGIGKTFIVNAILVDVKLNKSPIYVLDESHFHFYTSIPDRDCLVVVDNADLLFELYPESVDLFNSMKYQTLMFGRNLHGLYVHESNYGVLRPCMKGNEKCIDFIPMIQYVSEEFEDLSQDTISQSYQTEVHS